MTMYGSLGELVSSSTAAETEPNAWPATASPATAVAARSHRVRGGVPRDQATDRCGGVLLRRIAGSFLLGTSEASAENDESSTPMVQKWPAMAVPPRPPPQSDRWPSWPGRTLTLD